MGKGKTESIQEMERGNRPSEVLELGLGVKSARWKQEMENGSYFNKSSYKTFYQETPENEDDEPTYKDTIWFGAHQAQEVFKAVQNWNQRDAVKPADKEAFVEPVARKIDGHENMSVFSIDDVSVTVMDQISPNDKPYRVFVMGVDYQDAKGEWNRSHSFTRGQNIKLEVCLSGAMNYMKTPLKAVEGVKNEVKQTIEDEDIPF